MSGPEPWLRGPIEGVDPWLQPAAHAFVHVKEQVERLAVELTPDLLTVRPGQGASPAFHLRHIAGATDRLCGYARGESLSEAQRQALRREADDDARDPAALVGEAVAALDRALAQLRGTPRETLLAPRAVGVKALPSTVLGLLFHAAEHAQRHAGQLATTLRALRAPGNAR